MKNITTVEVSELPKCDFCADAGITTNADFDGKTTFGCWANMCESCFSEYGIGLGTGKGQALKLVK